MAWECCFASKATEGDALLREGWEPFAVTNGYNELHFVYHFRRVKPVSYNEALQGTSQARPEF